MSFTYQSRYQGPILAVLLDWAGTTMDYGCMAPAVVFVEVFRRNVFVHPFHEDDPHEVAALVGVDNVIFGSDFPHPEGLADPLSYVDALDGFDEQAKAKIMGGTLARLMKVDA